MIRDSSGLCDHSKAGVASVRMGQGSRLLSPLTFAPGQACAQFVKFALVEMKAITR